MLNDIGTTLFDILMFRSIYDHLQLQVKYQYTVMHDAIVCDVLTDVITI